MRTAARHTLNLLTALSLLLCLASLVLWERSHRVQETSIWNLDDGGQFCAVHARGLFLATRMTRSPPPTTRPRKRFHYIATSPPFDYSAMGSNANPRTIARWELPGPIIYWRWGDGSPPASSAELTYIAFPCWLAAALLAIPPTLRTPTYLKRRRRRNRECRGVCVACGYDLRMTPHRCPECGSIPRPATAEARSAHDLSRPR